MDKTFCIYQIPIKVAFPITRWWWTLWLKYLDLFISFYTVGGSWRNIYVCIHDVNRTVTELLLNYLNGQQIEIHGSLPKQPWLGSGPRRTRAKLVAKSRAVPVDLRWGTHGSREWERSRCASCCLLGIWSGLSPGSPFLTEVRTITNTKLKLNTLLRCYPQIH